MDKGNLKISQINNLIYLGPSDITIINSDDFQKLNIDVIINCAKEINNDNIKYQVINFSIIDNNIISFLENMDLIIGKMYSYILDNKRIYLHCTDSTSISPAIIIYYLMTYEKYNYDEAYDHIKSYRSTIDIDIEFENCLRTIES